MSRFTRYILAEFLKSFVLALIAMSTTMIVAVVLVEFSREGLAPLSLLRLLPYATPMALFYAIPGTTLFAICQVYGQMSANNEITAVKAAGIPPFALVRPVLALAFILSLLVVWLNDIAVSWGRTGMTRVVLESVEQVIYSVLRSDKAYAMRGFSINVRGVEGRKLIQPSITLRLEDNAPPMVCMAEEAELACDPAAETLRIVMRDCEVTSGKGRLIYPGKFVQDIPLAHVTRRGAETNRPSDAKLAQIPGEIKKQTEQIQEYEKSFAVEAAIQMMTGDLHALTDAEWDVRHAQIQNCLTRVHKLRTEPWRRFAYGFSCFFFVLVGAPVAIRLKKAFVWTTFLISLLTILLPYYLLMMYSAGEAKSGDMPPYFVWLGNVAIAIAGYVQMRKMQRY